MMKITIEAAAAVLGVDATCRDEDTIKTAYRKKALATHPDKGGDPEKFKEVSASLGLCSLEGRFLADCRRSSALQ